jgi:GNAT superfamily N-acetyltransferase
MTPAGPTIEIFPLDSPLLTPEQRAVSIWHAAAARGFLAPVLGGPEVRRELFLPGLNQSRVLIALYDGRYAGLASFTYKGQGPVSPRLGDFVRTYRAGALRRWVVYTVAEARLRSAGVYGCGLEVLPELRRSGVGSALMAEMVRIAGVRGAPVVEVDVRTTNQAMRALLHEMHFRPPNYPILSFARLNTSTTREFIRLVLPLVQDERGA